MNVVYLYEIKNDFDKEVPFVVSRLSQKRKNEKIYGFMLLKYALEKNFININYSDIKYTKNNKPYILNSLHFSITHSLNYVGVVVSKENVGVDIQYVNLKKRFNEDFYKEWVKKESFVKLIDGSIFNKYDQDIYNLYQIEEVMDSFNNKYYLSCTKNFSITYVTNL